MAQIPISYFVDISVAGTPSGLGEFNVNNIALFTSETPVSVDFDTYGVYSSASAVATDFGSNSEAYAQAVKVFSQTPNILAGGGRLIVIPFSSTAAGQIQSAEIAEVGSGYSVDDVLTVVQSGGSLGTLTVTDVDDNGAVLAFDITTAGSGYSVADGLETTVAPSGGTGCKVNILTVSSAVETLAEAVLRTQSLVSYCGILSTDYGLNTTWKDLADEIQAYGNKVLFLPSATYTDVAGAFTDIKDASDKRTRCLYYGEDDAEAARMYAAAYASRFMSVNYDGSNTCITMNLKELVGVDPDTTVTETRLAALETAGVDSYIQTEGGVNAVVSTGGNGYADSVLNLIWIVNDMKVRGFNALRELSSKIPQTEPGMSLLKGAYRRSCEQGVRNGYLAPGSWTAAEWFGDQDDFIKNIGQRGYYIYSAPVTEQSAADREARQAPLVQIAIKEAGAIHSSLVIINVNA